MSQRPSYDSHSIRAQFDEMPATYGIVNVVTSFGFCLRWRNQAIRELGAHRLGRVLDLMSGAGELWRSLAPRADEVECVVGIELSRGMAGRTEIEPGAFDTVVSSFGLKTFDEEQQARLAQRVAHALRPGGAFSFIEISAPRFAPLRWLYMFYVKHVIPIAGWVLLGNPANYRMLGVYTDAFGDCRHFARCAQGAGLDAEYVSYFFGCATGVRGRKRG